MSLLDEAKKYADGAATIAGWLGSGGLTVPNLVAQKRAETCIRCPMNIAGRVIDSVIALAIKKQLELKSKLQLRVNGEKSLHTCSGCGCVLRLKIWVPIESLGLDAEELNKFHSDCWMRKEFKIEGEPK